MNHGSLFSGGGGFDLAAETMGWTNIFHCETDPFCNRILDYYWPEAKCFGDIKTFNGKLFKGQIDIITGGFPCQPFSAAGKRRGTADDRYLWPEMLRVIREIRPRWVVAENVYGILNWNEGMVFDQVIADLEALGYEVQPFVLPACGVNAPHRRYRVWFVAYADHDGQHWSNRTDEKQSDKAGQHAQHDARSVGGNAADAYGAGLEGSATARHAAKKRPSALQYSVRLSTGKNWRSFPIEPPLCGGDDGLPRELDGITFSKWRRESIKVYGNAIVPQVALQIFKAISIAEQSGADGLL